MVFILGVNIKNNLNIIQGISKIYGIGLKKSEKICKILGYSKILKIKDLNNKDWEIILNYIKINNYIILKDLVKYERKNLLNLLNTKNYRSMRHKNNLPVRGQRTHCNKKTQKRLAGMRIANVRKFSTFSRITLPLIMQVKKKKKVIKKKKKKNFLKLIKFKNIKNIYYNVYIFSKYTNIIIFLYDSKGNMITWASGGSVGFKGKKKATNYSGNLAVNKIIKVLKEKKIKKLKIKLRGFGPSRRSSVKKFQRKGFLIKSIEDITKIPHNGCRKRKKKR